MKVLAIVAAIIAFVITAVLAFAIPTATVTQLIGILAIGCACSAAAAIVP